MCINDFYPGILRVIVEKANLDEEAAAEQVRNWDHGSVPGVTVISRAILVGFQPIGTYLPPFVEPAAAADKIMQQAADAFRRQSLQFGVAPCPFVGPFVPLNLTENARGNRVVNQVDWRERSIGEGSSFALPCEMEL